MLTLLAVILLFGCGNNNGNTSAEQTEAVTEKKNYFPVTAYVKGQLYDVRQKGITPMRFVTVNNHTDSAIIVFNDLDNYAKEFLQPEIDSANLINQYKESKFLDQTINAFTFTYEPVNPADTSLILLHWDVYVEPETGQVKRLYIVKKTSDNKMLQLTWLHNQWFKTTVIANNTSGGTTVEKEEKISWSY